MDNMENSLNKPSNEEILEVVEDGVVSLSELFLATKKRLDNTLVGDIPVSELHKVFHTIKKLNTTPTNPEVDKFQEVEEYITNTGKFNSSEGQTDNIISPSLQESNGKTYLNLGEDNIFEVIEQRGNIYIAYHPIKQTYIVYKFVGEDSDKNTSIFWGMENIEKTDIEGYYKISYFSIIRGHSRKKSKSNYYYIGKNGDTLSFGDYKIVGGLRKHGNAICFEGYNGVSELVIHNGDKVEKVPKGWTVEKISRSGKNLLWIIYDSCINNTTNSLFDLDSMEFIFENADIVNFDFFNALPTIIGNEISWELHKEREGLARILGKKVIKNKATL